MTEVLALKYRPKAFKDVIGQHINAIVLDRMVASDSVPQGLLFAGPRGSGKTSTARILANALDAGEPIEVDAASHGLVADVREMIETLRYTKYFKFLRDEWLPVPRYEQMQVRLQEMESRIGREDLH